MITFKQYCEEFIYHDSQVARKGTGPTVSGATKNGIMGLPAQVSTPIVGDNTSFSGNNVFMVKNANIPFDLKIKEIDGLFNIIIRTKGDDKFIPLSKTDLGKRTECSFEDKEEAIRAIRDLIFRISQVDITNS